MKVGIRFKLEAFIASLLLVVIVFLSVMVLSGIRDYQDKETEEILLKQKDMFEQYLNERLTVANGNEVNNNNKLFRASIFNKAWLRTIPANIYDTKGNILSGFNTECKLRENRYKKDMMESAVKDKMALKEVDDIVYFYSPIKYKDNTMAILELQYSIAENKKFYSSIKRMFYVIGIIALIIGVVLASVYFMKLVKDINKMKASVAHIENGEYDKIKTIDRNDELGELSKGISFMTDTIEENIRELQKERDTLSKAVEKLKIMDKQQKEFIGNVTHEFKTPISTIKAYSDMIGMYKDDEALVEQSTENISKECGRLVAMVDRILSLSALEKYDFEIEKNEINLKNILEQICSRMMAKVSKNNLKLEWEVENLNIIADEESIRHIVINLIDNAIKYNNEGGSIKVKGYKNENRVCIEVSDKGIGIPEEFISKIFEPFYRVESHRSRERGGTGLGLALVKKLVEKQNGNITVYSELRKGTTIAIELPL